MVIGSRQFPLRRVLPLLCLLLLIPLIPRSTPTRAAVAEAPALPTATRSADADFYGIVGRDPWFEWGTDPERYPNDVNRAALEGMARDLAYAGAGWVRIELRADHDANALGGPGYIDYRKWDWFIKECAPKYGLKVLFLLGSAVIKHSAVDPTVSFSRINDPADRPDGTNNYSRLFAARAKEIADHFGDSVAAYEILNEANISEILFVESGGTQIEFNPEIYGALLTDVYAAIKPAHPKVQLIVGGLLYGFRPTGSADYDYLYVLYQSKRAQEYRLVNGRYPWDGVASHAYYVGDVRKIVDHYWQLRGVMVAAGDDNNKLWLTEIGLVGGPSKVRPEFLAAMPTTEEEKQAAFIRELFPLLLNEVRGFVANVFWFKYEDFLLPNGWANYGLVRLPIDTRGTYGQPPVPRKPAFAAFQSFANPGALPTAPESAERQPVGAYYFPQTRHAISGAFRQYWEQNGGLDRFGYPITSVFESGGLRVQYFERARFEYHPENADPDYQVQLGLLTAFLTQTRTFPKATPITPTPRPRPAGTPTARATPTCPPGSSCPPVSETPTTPSPTAPSTLTPTPTMIYFAETGHNLGGSFYTYWRARGGLASFGYPISEELREVNQADGKTYTVQYFERARLEYHPENAGTPYAVLLGLMGLETINTGGWYR
ncbi:MAG: hypothetical protein AVDCRST_MAG18-2930 [uncultured Thermomicrobiales bacterium]|uniref:Glycoside hydrolase family 5 domain-containing protein n=1 Tax=uncultured Thermomicrobiales bacterium TaxID=1645740 RepID=A0A6J4VH86_9BACT|nr:MAG: hypothetical protein AVDCRST_MAG18-2930 [uncultured Thermomicrobiales bacterium]